MCVIVSVLSVHKSAQNILIRLEEAQWVRNIYRNFIGVIPFQIKKFPSCVWPKITFNGSYRMTSNFANSKIQRRLIHSTKISIIGFSSIVFFE